MTKTVYLGGSGRVRRIGIGGAEPVSIQTMWKEGIDDLDSNPSKLERILSEIQELEGLGCDIIRFAVPDMASASGLCKIAANTSVPLVADIHFDYRLALECLKGDVAAIRINPGNIGSRERVEAVVNACKPELWAAPRL